MTLIEQAQAIGFTVIDGKVTELQEDVSALDCVHRIYEAFPLDHPACKMADDYDTEFDTLPDLPEDTTSPEYTEIHNRLCESYDTLEGEFLTKLIDHFNQ